MDFLNDKLKYSKKGITLTSLIVTIIVLLILAGVSIATLIGNNRTFNYDIKIKRTKFSN